jgi:hypothetical protein
MPICELCTAAIPSEKPRYWWMIDHNHVVACLACMVRLEMGGLGMDQAETEMYIDKRGEEPWEIRP